MNIELFLLQFLSIFDDPPVGVNAGSEFRTLPGWDSLAAIGLLAMVNAEYDVILSGDELKACATIQDIFELVGRKIG